MINIIITAAIMALFGTLIIIELTNWIVDGGFIKEEKSCILAEKLSQNCHIYDDVIIWSGHDFASKSIGILSRWYIFKDGVSKRIFIGSKMNKMLNEKYKELRAVENKNCSNWLL